MIKMFEQNCQQLVNGRANPENQVKSNLFKTNPE